MQSDAELVRRCRTGEEAAFRELVDAHHDRVYRTAYALTSDSDWTCRSSRSPRPSAARKAQ